MSQSFPTKSDAEQMRDLGILLAAIVRKAASRADQDPLAMELKELAERAEAIVGEIATSRG